MKWNLKEIMTRAWGIYRKPKYYKATTFGEALHRAWAEAKEQPEVESIIEKAKAESGITEEMHQHYGWTMLGREVIHGSENVLQVVIPYPAWGDGRTKVVSFFTKSQTAEIVA